MGVRDWEAGAGAWVASLAGFLVGAAWVGVASLTGVGVGGAGGLVGTAVASLMGVGVGGAGGLVGWE